MLERRIVQFVHLKAQIWRARKVETVKEAASRLFGLSFFKIAFKFFYLKVV